MTLILEKYNWKIGMKLEEVIVLAGMILWWGDIQMLS